MPALKSSGLQQIEGSDNALQGDRLTRGWPPRCCPLNRSSAAPDSDTQLLVLHLPHTLGINLETAPMPFQNRMMTLIAFLQAQNCSNLPGSWRHPSTMPDFLTPEYYQRIARTLEDGKIQMAFFDDRLALPDL